MPKPPRPRMTRLKFEPWEYNPQALQNKSERELRQEYSRLRSIANKRLDRLISSEFYDTQAVAYNAGRYVPLKAVRNASELRHLLIDVSKFILSEQSTVTGQRDITDRLVRTWRDDKGYGFINAGNVRAWVEFLDYVQSVEGYVYDTSTLADAFEESQLDNTTRNADQIEGAYEYYRSITAR